MSVDIKDARSIFVLFSVNQRPFLRAVLDGIRAYSQSHEGWNISLPFYHSLIGSPKVDEGPVCGQISGVPAEDNLLRLKKRGIPTILIGFSPRPKWASTVVLNYEATALKAIKHFTDQGVEHIAMAASRNERKHDHLELRRGVSSQASKLDVPYFEFTGDIRGGPQDIRLRQQVEAMAEWLKSLPRQTGIICGDDEYAARVMSAAAMEGLTVGRDLLLLGCGNDTVYCESVTPSLSSIMLDYREMGWLAAKKLNCLMDDPDEAHEEIVVESSEAHCRRSSRRTGAPGSFVAQAMDAIWNAASLPSTVDDLVRQLGVNRRTLDRHFEQQLGRSISTELRQARLTLVKQLLANDRLSLAEVALRCGYYDQAHFSREIKRETGQTPSMLRRA